MSAFIDEKGTMMTLGGRVRAPLRSGDESKADPTEAAFCRPALFLDRDGIVNVDTGYAALPAEIVFLDGIFELCRAARGWGMAVVIVTNQSGIARGFYDEAAFHSLSWWMMRKFAHRSAPIDAIYYCPHHPTAGSGHFTIECECRKPRPGMMLAAARELRLDLGRSAMVGDSVSDVEAARRAGIGTTVLLCAGSGAPVAEGVHVRPDLVATQALLEEIVGRPRQRHPWKTARPA